MAKIGENQLTKTLRLIKELQQELVKFPEEEYIELRLEADGSGELIYCNDGGPCTLFTFGSLEILYKYLEGSQLTRLLMTFRA